MRQYHRLIWSKPLPSGTVFALAPEPNAYLVHRSTHGTFYMASDAITTNLTGRAARVISQLSEDERPPSLGYTVGSSILFPGDKVDGQMTINGARGFHPSIADRFDLTLECIRRHYLAIPSPLQPVLSRYASYFSLFEEFDRYVDFFLLQDLIDEDRQAIHFLHRFDNFESPAVPSTARHYLAYVAASNAFIEARNRRIAAYALTAEHPSSLPPEVDS